MDCPNCALAQRHFYCQNCLRAHLRDLRAQLQHAAAERDDHVQRAAAALDPVRGPRERRADIARGQARLDDVQGALLRLRKENDKARHRLRTLRESLATRRRTLSHARLLPATTPASLPAPLSARAATLARARGGLVAELVEVFHVVEVGGRPPLGGKAGARGEWTIGGLVLPVPGDIRRYPPVHVNAVLTHTVHFLGLLAFYLGVKLPFEVVWSGGRLGVGQPWIRAVKGTEAGSWAKWTSRHCLHVSSTPTPAPAPDTPALPAALASDSVTEHAAPASSFTTAYAMLLFDVAYLAHTQAIDVPLAQAGDALATLWAVCCSPELGRRSHATHPPLPAPTPPAFALDFAQLLQATAATPRARPRRASRAARIAEEDEWEVVEDVEP